MQARRNLEHVSGSREAAPRLDLLRARLPASATEHDTDQKRRGERMEAGLSRPMGRLVKGGADLSRWRRQRTEWCPNYLRRRLNGLFGLVEFIGASGSL